MTKEVTEIDQTYEMESVEMTQIRLNPKTRSEASSATRELDELMNSLNTFQMQNQNAPKAPLTENNNVTPLDDMLGNLEETMVKQGVKTVPKGVCAACLKAIVGQVVTAMGKTWHQEVGGSRPFVLRTSFGF